ncbi:MAG TPA: DUF4349 domain-containing protein [Clostridia bacterium]|nr:DUF4349 domain-containing protein [Clostridia bacterium]
MTCEQYRLLLHDLLDGTLPDQTAQTMAAHEAECPACAARRAELYALMQTLHTLDEDLEPPPSFGQAWRQAVRAEAANRRRRPLRMWQTWAAAAAALVCLVGGTTLMRAGILPGLPAPTPQYSLMQDSYEGGSTPYAGSGTPNAKYNAELEMDSGSMGSQERSYAALPESPATLDDSAAEIHEGEDAVLRGGVKILRSGYFHLATANFDKDMESILTLVDQTGGWIEYQSVNGEPIAQNPDGGRYGSLTLRIAELDRFVTELTAIGRLQNSELSAQDISDQYRDQAARLTQYKAQRDRLEQLLRSAESVADIIEIEERLTEVQYQIDTLTGMLQGWDSRAQYAQVIVSLTETTESAQALSEDPSVGVRIREGLIRSFKVVGSFLKDMAVFVVVLAPWLLAVAALTGAVLFGIRRVRRRNQREE